MKIFSANVMTKISINYFLWKNFWKNTAFKEIIASSEPKAYKYYNEAKLNKNCLKGFKNVRLFYAWVWDIIISNLIYQGLFISLLNWKLFFSFLCAKK